MHTQHTQVYVSTTHRQYTQTQGHTCACLLVHLSHALGIPLCLARPPERAMHSLLRDQKAGLTHTEPWNPALFFLNHTLLPSPVPSVCPSSLPLAAPVIAAELRSHGAAESSVVIPSASLWVLYFFPVFLLFKIKNYVFYKESLGVCLGGGLEGWGERIWRVSPLSVEPLLGLDLVAPRS